MSKITLDSYFQGKVGTIWCHTLEQFRSIFTCDELKGSCEDAQVRLYKTGSKIKIIAEINDITNNADKSFLEFVIPCIKERDQRLEKYFECRELKRFSYKSIFDRLFLKAEEHRNKDKKHDLETLFKVTFNEDFFKGLKPNIDNLLLKINENGFEYFAIAKALNESNGCAFAQVPLEVIGIIFSYVDYVDLS